MNAVRFLAPTSALEHLSRPTQALLAIIQCSPAQNATRRRSVEVIICMITREFSLISMTSQASLSVYLSISLRLTKSHSRTIIPGALAPGIKFIYS